jgi:upstream activation factor subunit UAF30
MNLKPPNDSEYASQLLKQPTIERIVHLKKGHHRMPKKKKTNAAFLKMAQAPLKPSPQLAEVLGSAAPISRPQVAKKVWAYIKKHKLQDPKKRREIVADDKLKPVFGKARLDMFQMTKAISKHLSK